MSEAASRWKLFYDSIIHYFFSAIALSPYFNKIPAKYQQKENQSIKVCIAVLHKQFSRSQSKNGQLRPIIHELKYHLHFPLGDTFVITYRESICLQICPFTSEWEIMFLFKLSHPCPKYYRVARTAMSCFLGPSMMTRQTRPWSLNLFALTAILCGGQMCLSYCREF